MSIDSLSSRLAFIRLDADTRSTLKELRPLIARVLPGILDDFYRHIASYSEVARLIPDQTVMQHARDMQIKHWDLIACARFDATYVASVTKVGQTHHRLGLGPQWYIGSYNFLLAALLRVIALEGEAGWFGRTSEAVRIKTADQAAAITKAGLLDMELALAVYLETGMRAKEAFFDKLLKASFRQTIETVSTASIQFEGTAHSLVQTANKNKQIAANAAEAFEQVSANIQTIETASDSFSESNNAISQQVEASHQITVVAVQQIEKANTHISTLSQSAKQIGGVVKTITDIAEQTNLLALNATIEAARAGTAGRGFSVVAQEVKSLANQTAKATAEIGMQITQVETATRDSVGAINEIFATIRRASEISSSTAETLEQQDAATKNILNSVRFIANSTSEVAANMGEVTAGAASTGVASDQMLIAARALAGESQRLKNEIESFLATSRLA